MRSLKKALQEHELIVLRIIGEWWELDLTGQNKKTSIATLVAELPNLGIPQELMYLPQENVEAVKALVRAGGKMPLATFTRQFGEVRQMGPGALEREEPWLDPQSAAEDLWYRGLIFKGIDRDDPSVEYMFMPDEFFSMFDLETLDAGDESEEGEADQTAEDPIEFIEGPEDNKYEAVATPDGLEKKKTDLKGVGRSIPAELLQNLSVPISEDPIPEEKPAKAKSKVKKVKKKPIQIKRPPKKKKADAEEEGEQYVDDADELPPEFDEGDDGVAEEEKGMPRTSIEEREAEPEPEWATRKLAPDAQVAGPPARDKQSEDTVSRVQVKDGVIDPKETPAAPPIAPQKKTPRKAPAVPTGAGAPADTDLGNGRVAASTEAVDDFVTLLTLAQMEQLRDGNADQVKPYLLNQDENRLNLLIAIGVNLLYLKRIPEGYRPTKAAVEWLQEGREAQLQMLASGWQTCSWNGLRHVPTLKCEGSNWSNDPELARKALLDSLVLDDSWSLYTDVIQRIKRETPDFQRPNGNYDMWYIRDLASGEYVKGFDNWEMVEGRLLRYLVEYPLHWLGMADIGPERYRLTERAMRWIGDEPPNETGSTEALTLSDDGLLQLSPAVDRYKRFQAGRFARLQPATPGKPFAYRVTPSSLQQATDVGIGPKRVLQFLTQASADGKVPAGLKRAIERWSENGIEGMVEQTVVIRVKDPKILDTLRSRPETRPFLAENLSETAVIVMPGKWAELCQAATQLGLLLEPDGF